MKVEFFFVEKKKKMKRTASYALGKKRLLGLPDAIAKEISRRTRCVFHNCEGENNRDERFLDQRKARYFLTRAYARMYRRN